MKAFDYLAIASKFLLLLLQLQKLQLCQQQKKTIKKLQLSP